MEDTRFTWNKAFQVGGTPICIASDWFYWHPIACRKSAFHVAVQTRAVCCCCGRVQEALDHDTWGQVSSVTAGGSAHMVPSQPEAPRKGG